MLLSIGGAGTDITDATVDFDSAVSQATSPADFEAAFTASMQTLMTTYGFDGFDFDIESGLYAANSFTEPDSGCEDKTTYAQACDISYLASIINSFKADNPNVLITLAPQITNIAATATY